MISGNGKPGLNSCTMRLSPTSMSRGSGIRKIRGGRGGSLNPPRKTIRPKQLHGCWTLVPWPVAKDRRLSALEATTMEGMTRRKSFGAISRRLSFVIFFTVTGRVPPGGCRPSSQDRTHGTPTTNGRRPDRWPRSTHARSPRESVSQRSHYDDGAAGRQEKEGAISTLKGILDFAARHKTFVS